MAVGDVDPFSQHDVAEDGEEGEDRGEACGSVHDQERYVIDLEAVCEIPDPCPSLVCVRYDDDLVAPVDELAGELVDVTFDSSRLGEEEVANHSDVIRSPHCS